jgi:putative membrane protein
LGTHRHRRDRVRVRFVRTGRLLDDEETHSASGVCAELILSAALALIVAGFSAFLVLT